MLANKKLMILGAGRGQLGLYHAAKKLGYHTIAASIKGDYPGFQLADEICYVDISNPEQVYLAAKKQKVDGVATACLDTGIAALGYTCERLGLCGLSENAARLSGDKLLMKQAFMKGNVSTARFHKISTEQELKEALSNLCLPLIVKAVDLQGSCGIYIANSEEEAFAGFHGAMSETRQDFCIVEEFIEGYEFGAQAFIYQGDILFVLPCGDKTYLSNTAVPVGHYAPLETEADIIRQAEEQVKNAIGAIGLDNCAVNVDLILKDGKVYVIELTGRAGANCLPEITSFYYGIEYYEMVVEMAMGGNPRPYYNKRQDGYTAVSARMLLSEKSGLIKEIRNTNPDEDDIKEISFFVREGGPVHKFSNSKDCLGQVIVTGDTLVQAENKMEQVLSNIVIELE